MFAKQIIFESLILLTDSFCPDRYSSRILFSWYTWKRYEVTGSYHRKKNKKRTAMFLENSVIFWDSSNGHLAWLGLSWRELRMSNSSKQCNRNRKSTETCWFIWDWPDFKNIFWKEGMCLCVCVCVCVCVCFVGMRKEGDSRMWIV